LLIRQFQLGGRLGQRFRERSHFLSFFPVPHQLRDELCLSIMLSCPTSLLFLLFPLFFPPSLSLLDLLPVFLDRSRSDPEADDEVSNTFFQALTAPITACS
jgi:hypothetical protein